MPRPALALLVALFITGTAHAADGDVLPKAVEWAKLHGELTKPDDVDKARAAMAKVTGDAPGKSVRGYESKVDGSVQPYALTLPSGFDPQAAKRWPLVVKLHGRATGMNELSFILRHAGKPAPEGQDWIEVEPYGRGNNAFRWAGETDVHEVIADVSKRYRIDRQRIVLWGFSMGGAGAWHMGLHHPSKWCSVGAGAGFVDFYEYQNREEKLPRIQDALLGIYDAKDYVLNAANVPIVGYGGELDKQLLAAKTMHAAGEKLDVPVKLIVGPKMGHKFDPESFDEFMAFHREHMQAGRPRFPGPRELRFTTRTLKYNACNWLTIEEMVQPYAETTVESRVDDKGEIRITTKNVAILQISRDLTDRLFIDGDIVPLSGAADGLLPGVYYEHNGDAWFPISYEESKDFYQNASGRKRHGVQGPIDDAFMQPFVCVKGTGEPWSRANDAWATWTLERFENEWSQWMRGELPVITDTECLDDEFGKTGAYGRNIVLFGDPGSNAAIAKVLEDLPVEWTEEKLVVDGVAYDPGEHGLSLILPNPLNKLNYIVINSGHTFHEKDFKASNAWLFPRLGDIAVQRFTKTDDGKGYTEEVVFNEITNGAWRLPPKEYRVGVKADAKPE